MVEVMFRTQKPFFGRRKNKNWNTKGKKAVQERNQTAEVEEGDVWPYRPRPSRGRSDQQSDQNTPEAPNKPSASGT